MKSFCRTFSLTTLLCLIATDCLAITNIETERPNLPTEGWSGTLKLTLNGKTGNQREESDEGSLKVIYRADDDIFLNIIAKDYATQHQTKTTDNTFLHTRWVHLWIDRWASEAFAQWEKDEFDNLKSRTLLGGGARYLIGAKKDVYSFVVGLGAFHEVEEQDLITYQETNRVWRMNSYYAYKYQISDQLLFANILYYQPRLNDWNDSRVLLETGLSVTMTQKLQLKISHKLTHDSRPANNPFSTPPIHNYETNTEWKTSLGYNF